MAELNSATPTIRVFDSTGYFRPVNEHGQPCVRTKRTHPYSYDGFVMHDRRQAGQATGTVYSDRLWQWDPQKHDELCQKHFGNEGQLWNGRNPQKIEAFLTDYFGHSVGLRLVMEYCNQATGYPVWRFDYQE